MTGSVRSAEPTGKLADIIAAVGEPYFRDDAVVIYNSDCRDILPKMPQVDAIVTDPPYGLEFMGKEWDRLAMPNPGNIGGFADGNKPSFERVRRHLPAMQAWHHAWAVEALRVLKPGGHLLAFGGTRTHHRLMCALEDAGFEIRDTLMWLYGSGFPKSLNLDGEWEGWGTALKPAWEPIVLARKPLTGTVEANVQAHGTGALNVDGCRLPTDDNLDGGSYSGGGNPTGLPGDTRDFKGAGMFAEGGGRLPGQYVPPAGRWPANVVLDEEAAAMLDAQSGERKAGGKVQGTEPSHTGDNGIYGTWERVENSPYGDSGGASRFFYCAKASREEREAGVGGEPVRRSDGREKDIENPRLRTSPRRNAHPTVKPVALMRWLVRLVTPPGGLIVDPFIGSGTTAVAAVHEGFRCIGIDNNAEYLATAQERVERANLEREHGPEGADAVEDGQGVLL
ncbi:hypothetical protein LCGC14_0989940 [marine sediment metagenome]|uniref:DNA methylase N-4/N-6 domain-containing protein n=1 Tax=marine sediment metagenome TaxID=412755 RepID=A0A0F9QPH8_9ZZZZ